MTLNTKQMNDIVQPVPTDPLDGAYYYLNMIELAFGRQKAQYIQLKYKLGADTQKASTTQNTPKAALVMGQKFKDQIEVKLSHLQSIIHQLTKGSYLLRDSEFTKVFRQAGISVNSADSEFLQQSFYQMKNIQTQAIDFRAFVRHYGVKETTAQIIQAL